MSKIIEDLGQFDRLQDEPGEQPAAQQKMLEEVFGIRSLSNRPASVTAQLHDLELFSDDKSLVADNRIAQSKDYEPQYDWSRKTSENLPPGIYPILPERDVGEKSMKIGDTEYKITKNEKEQTIAYTDEKGSWTRKEGNTWENDKTGEKWNGYVRFDNGNPSVVFRKLEDDGSINTSTRYEDGRRDEEFQKGKVHITKE
jgi:hypothetical protein